LPSSRSRHRTTASEWSTGMVLAGEQGYIPRVPKGIRLHLVDNDPDVVAAWQTEFARYPEVEIRLGDILALASHAVVSPANASGFMDGGIDRAYADFFGTSLEAAVRECVAFRPEGYLPIGASAAVATGHTRIRYLIIAPTMLSPEFVEATNAYRALRAVLRLASSEPALAGSVYCPGMCTGVGGVPAIEAAHEMAAAYADWCEGS
jgi:O-acetyl-ADP-ribose deacetylase (regulator of RNase III)